MLVRVSKPDVWSAGPRGCGTVRRWCRRAGFTLIELLAVIAMIALLTGLLLPALSSTKQRGQRVSCLSNLKQLALCAQLYAADNTGRLVENLPLTVSSNVWVTGNMKGNADSTNEYFIRQGRFFPYASQVGVYRCPADSSQMGGTLRVRSYAMNSWMGSRHMENSGRKVGFRTFVKDSELAASRPAALWVLLDEHPASIDDGCFLVTMDDSEPFACFPAARHQQGYGLNFADGHAEVHPLRDPTSQRLETSAVASQVSNRNSDWLKLKSVTTTP